MSYDCELQRHYLFLQVSIYTYSPIYKYIYIYSITYPCYLQISSHMNIIFIFIMGFQGVEHSAKYFIRYPIKALSTLVGVSKLLSL